MRVALDPERSMVFFDVIAVVVCFGVKFLQRMCVQTTVIS